MRRNQINVLRAPRDRELIHVWLTVIILIVLSAYHLSIEMVAPLKEYFGVRTSLPVVTIINQGLFFWLLGLLWLAYRNWQSAVNRRGELERVLSSISPDVFMVVTPDRKIAMCNSSVKPMFGYTPEEVINKTTDLLYFDRRIEHRKGEIFDRLQTFGFHVGYATGRRNNGETFPLEIVTGDLSGHPGAVVLVRDISERKRAEQALNVTNRELESALRQLRDTQKQIIEQERLRVLGQMASYIAHEFNNALTPILGFAEMILDTPKIMNDPKELNDYIRDIHTAARDAGAVVRRLSQFYRQSDPSVNVGPVILNEAIAETISMTKPKWKTEAQAMGRSIQINTDLGDVPLVPYSSEEMHEVLTNLIFNAVDAMTNGGVITISTRSEEDNVILRVADTGTGMDQETVDHCLEPFFTAKGPSGTGLGLAVVTSIIRRHHGDIKIETAPGQGTTFIFTMPIFKRGTFREKATLAELPTGKIRILVVDDEPLVRKVVARYLESEGHSIEVAENGNEAFDVFQKNAFDLILTDWAMPEMNGSQLATAVKKIAPHMPIIMMTGVDSAVWDSRTNDQAVTMIIRKPLTRDALVRAVADALVRAAAKTDNLLPMTAVS